MRKGIWFLVGSVAAGLLAAMVAVRTVRAFNETQPVLVATRDLQPYTELTREVVKVAELPKVSIPADAIRDPALLEGKFLKDLVLAGEVIREARLATTRGQQILAAKLTELKDPRLRAFALPYDAASAVGGKVRPGDRVDIIASVKIDAGSGYSVGVGKVVGQAVPVLEVNEQGGSAGGTIVLALQPEEIEDIAFALTSGKLRFALNPYDTDTAAARTEGVTGRAWLEKYGFLSAPGDVEPRPEATPADSAR